MIIRTELRHKTLIIRTRLHIAEVELAQAHNPKAITDTARLIGFAQVITAWRKRHNPLAK